MSSSSFNDLVDQAIADLDFAQMRMLQNIPHKPVHIRWREARMALSMARRSHLNLKCIGDVASAEDLALVAELYAAHPDAQMISTMLAWVAHHGLEERHTLGADVLNTFDDLFFEMYEVHEDLVAEWASKEFLANPTFALFTDEMDNAHRMYVRHLFTKALNHTLAKAGMALVK